MNGFPKKSAEKIEAFMQKNLHIKVLMFTFTIAITQLFVTTHGASAAKFKSKSLSITFILEEENLWSDEDFFEAYNLLPLGRKIGLSERNKLLKEACEYMFSDSVGARLISQGFKRGVLVKRTLLGGSYKWGMDENQEVILKEVAKCKFQFSGIELRPGSVWEIMFWIKDDKAANYNDASRCTLIKEELEDLNFKITISSKSKYNQSMNSYETLNLKSNLLWTPLPSLEYNSVDKREIKKSICTGWFLEAKPRVP